MENFFGLLRLVFLGIITLFFMHVIRLLSHNMDPEKKDEKNNEEYIITQPDIVSSKVEPSTAYLTIDVGKKFLPSVKKEQIPLKSKTTMGRNKKNDIVIEDPYVSNRHTVIESEGKHWVLNDSKSKNETFVNDAVLNGHVVLQNNDLIRIGSVTFKFHQE
ncbi:MAG: FHA domain-containing protein [Vulcanimicrobiota bacterium]